MKKQEDDLMDIREVMMDINRQKFDTSEKKIRAFVENIRHPYAYKVGDVVVHISFSGEQSIDKCFSNFLAGM